MNDNIIIGECNRGLSKLVRPHFTEGLLLQDDDLTTGVSYTRELSRLMFRTMFGCGVLCGLKVLEPASQCGKLKIVVEKGAALTCIGDPVELTRDQTIEIDECKFNGDEIWIGLRHYEKCCAPRTTVCTADDEDSPAVCTRERDGYELCAFSERPGCACGSSPAPAPGKKQEGKSAASAAQQASANADPLACGAGQEDRDGRYNAGLCPCDCCDCEWILLAKAIRSKEKWKVDHSVRRFVRPVLMRDPLSNKA